jgi:hypothetical protein
MCDLSVGFNSILLNIVRVVDTYDPLFRDKEVYQHVTVRRETKCKYYSYQLDGYQNINFSVVLSAPLYKFEAAYRVAYILAAYDVCELQRPFKYVTIGGVSSNEYQNTFQSAPSSFGLVGYDTVQRHGTFRAFLRSHPHPQILP